MFPTARDFCPPASMGVSPPLRQKQTVCGCIQHRCSSKIIIIKKHISLPLFEGRHSFRKLVICDLWTSQSVSLPLRYTATKRRAYIIEATLKSKNILLLLPERRQISDTVQVRSKCFQVLAIYAIRLSESVSPPPR